MKIAVTYDNGNIFQHFGRTENFKIYTVEDGQIVSDEVIGAGGIGHEALAGLLADLGADTVICGGIGGGTQSALQAAGLEIVSGAQGSADEAVRAFLAGELTSEGVNCDHHHDSESHGGCCGSGEGRCGGDAAGTGENGEDGCGGCCGGDVEESCGGCCSGGCHEMKVILEGKNAGKTVKTHYEGTFNNGTVFDSSYDRGEPLEFVCGTGMMIPGFDKAVVDMNVGDIVNIHLTPEEAYGERDPRAIFTVEISQMEGAEGLKTGDHVYLSNAMGQPFPVVVTAKDDRTITFDANHEMAGKELNFKIELLSAED